VKRFDDNLGARLKDDERTIEECDRGMPARGGADRVALLHEIAGRCGCVATRSVAHFDRALEHREIRACRDGPGLSQHDAGTGRHEQERRSQSGGERERTTRPFRCGRRRHGDERHECRCMRVVDRVTNFCEGRGDDLELDASEHVFRFVLGRLIKRIGHRECGARASELNEGHGAKLAEAAWQLTHNGGLGRGGQRCHRVPADASERVGERLRSHEARAKDRVRKGLLAVARPVEVLDLPRAEDLF
jgi:hypothetical protein